MKTPLIILGAGGFAREAFCWLPHDKYSVEAFFTEDASVVSGLSNFSIQITSDLKALSASQFIVAVGDPHIRSKLWDLAISAGKKPCAPIIHPMAMVSLGCEIGEGSILCPGTILTTNVKVGKGFIGNLNCTIGHDTNLGDFVTLNPGANVSGSVSIGDRVLVGTNSAIRERLCIGSDAIIGMGSIIVKPVMPGVTVMGNPGRPRHLD